jgi:hypothetical protein
MLFLLMYCVAKTSCSRRGNAWQWTASVLWLILIIFHRIISEKFKRSLSFLASYTFGERNIFYCGCAVYVGGLEFVFGFWLLVFLAVFDAAFLSTYWQDSKDDAAWELWFFDRAVMDLAGKILFAGILRFAASRNRMSFLLIQRLNVARLKADVQMNPFSVDNLKNWLRPKPLGMFESRKSIKCSFIMQ